MEAPTLWHFAVSHYTEKARWALDYKGIPHHRRLGFLDYPIRNALRTGQLRLPVLFSQGRTIRDSTRIIAYLEECQPEPRLHPVDGGARARALALEDFFDEEVGAHIRAVLVDGLFRHGKQVTIDAFGMGQGEGPRRVMSILYPAFRAAYSWRHRINPRDVEIGWEKLAAGVRRLEDEVGPSGYLVGDSFSVADLTAASLLYPFACPDQYPYRLEPDFKRVAAEILSRVDGRFAGEWVADMYARHRGTSCEILAA